MAKYFEFNHEGVLQYRLAVRDAMGVPRWLCDENGDPVDFRLEILACRGQADMDALTGRIMRAVEKREGPVRQFVIAQHHKPRQEGPQAAPGPKDPKTWAYENIHVDPPWRFDANPGHESSWFDKNWRERERYGDRSRNDGKYRFDIRFRPEPPGDSPAAEEGTRMHKDFQARIDGLVEEQLNVNYADVEARIMAAFGLGEDALKDVRSAYAGVKVKAEEFNEVLRDIGKTIKSPKQRSHPVSPRKGRHNQQIPNPKWKRK